MTKRRLVALAAGGTLALLVLGAATAFAINALRGDSVTRADEAVLARPDHPVRSPSGAFQLEVVAGEDSGGNQIEHFRIRDDAGNVVHDDRTEFSVRHTTFFLWADATDEVWVYSGDVGTFYWGRDQQTGAWSQAAYADHRDEKRPPQFLIRARPQFFDR